MVQHFTEHLAAQPSTREDGRHDAIARNAKALACDLDFENRRDNYREEIAKL
jgi:hypothetical protein